MSDQIFMDVFRNRYLLNCILNQQGKKLAGEASRKPLKDWIHGDKAVALSHISLVQDCLDHNPDQMDFTAAAFENAAKNNDLPTLKLLTKRLPGLSATYKAMDAAASGGYLDCVKWLHENRNEECSYQAYVGSAAGGHKDVLIWLHENMVPLEFYADRAFCSAAGAGNLGLVKFIYETAPEVVSATDALHKAVSGGHQDVVEFLFEECNGTPTNNTLDLAAAGGSIKMVRWLAERTALRFSPFTIEQACERGHLDILRVLIGGTLGNGRPPLPRVPANLVAAARNGHFHVVKYLCDETQIRPNSAALTAAAGNGYMNMLRYMWASHIGEVASGQAMDSAARNGHLDVCKWLFDHGGVCSTYAMDWAAEEGRLSVVQWLHSKGAKCTKYAIDHACKNGHLELAKWMKANRPEGCTSLAVEYAAERTDGLEMLKWLHSVGVHGSQYCLDVAGKGGSLEIVEWLNGHGYDATTYAMDTAAANGHLQIVRYLHENRSEGCTVYAMNAAAANGHIKVVSFLHKNRTEGCTTDAIDFAAGNGHLNIVKFLYENRREGWTAKAADWAAAKGHIHTLKYIVEVMKGSSSDQGLYWSAYEQRFNCLCYLIQLASGPREHRRRLKVAHRSCAEDNKAIRGWCQRQLNCEGSGSMEHGRHTENPIRIRRSSKVRNEADESHDVGISRTHAAPIP